MLGGHKLVINVKQRELIKQPQTHIVPKEKLELLARMLDKGEELLKLLNQKDDEYISEVLIIPNELVKMYDLKLKSVRLSKEIEEEFDKVSKKYNVYSKTSLINMALKEFVEKYK